MGSGDREHSPKGGSSAERWINCPGSGVLLSTLELPPTDEKDYLVHGLAYHEAAAYCLLNKCDAWEISGKEFYGKIKVSGDELDAIQTYLDFCRPIMENSMGWQVEQMFSDPKVHADFKGFVDFYNVDVELLTIVDYKHGEGIVVEPANNAQLLYYAYGIMRLYPHVDRVRLVIVQPRAYHNEGPIREWEVTAEYVREWAEGVMIPAMNRASVEETFVPGEWCRFCPAKLYCPVLTALFQAAATANTKSVPHMDDNRLGHEFQLVAAVKFYIKALEERVFDRLQNGHDVNGFKLVNKQSKRVFKEGAADEFKNKFGALAMEPAELKSPAQMAKINAAAKEMVKSWAYFPDIGLTVAPLLDSRPAIRIEKATEVFSHYANQPSDTSGSGNEKDNTQ